MGARFNSTGSFMATVQLRKVREPLVCLPQEQVSCSESLSVSRCSPFEAHAHPHTKPKPNWHPEIWVYGKWLAPALPKDAELPGRAPSLIKVPNLPLCNHQQAEEEEEKEETTRKDQAVIECESVVTEAEVEVEMHSTPLRAVQTHAHHPSPANTHMHTRWATPHCGSRPHRC